MFNWDFLANANSENIYLWMWSYPVKITMTALGFIGVYYASKSKEKEEL